MMKPMRKLPVIYGKEQNLSKAGEGLCSNAKARCFVHREHLTLEEPRGPTLSQVCPRKLHWNRDGILEDPGRELLRLRLTGRRSIDSGGGSIAQLGVCSTSGCSNRDQYATLPVAAVQLWLTRNAIFDQAAPFKVLVMIAIVHKGSTAN
jgi:hypothetical protein